jgi:hypothetical protein
VATVTGLDATGLVLQLNGGSNLPLSTNGAFLFAAVVSSGSSYAVSIATQPSTESCSIANASGIATSNVSNIGVSCTTIVRRAMPAERSRSIMSPTSRWVACRVSGHGPPVPQPPALFPCTARSVCRRRQIRREVVLAPTRGRMRPETSGSLVAKAAPLGACTMRSAICGNMLPPRISGPGYQGPRVRELRASTARKGMRRRQTTPGPANLATR